MLYFHRPNIKIATVHGELEVDENGKVTGLTKAQEKEFKDIVGYTYEEEKATTKKTTKKEEDKQEDVEEKKPTTRKTTRKTTTRKTTKKEEE